MTLLVLNAGSSSLKFAVWINHHERWRGQIEQIGGAAYLMIEKKHQPVVSATMAGALKQLKIYLFDQGIRPTTVAHRIVHGGDWYNRPTRLTPTVLRRLQTLCPLAPLHLPLNLSVVRLAQRYWPDSVAWGVFDTAVFHDLPTAARVYALPTAVTKKFHIRKYGFHGISHAWAFQQAAKQLGRRPRSFHAVTVHLGAGDSITQWESGRAVDTSMGFTPLEGLTMATRTGDLDPMIPLFLQQRGGFSIRQVVTMLNRQSGLYGLTGLKDIRDVLGAAGHPVPGWPRRRWTTTKRRQSKLALEIFRYDIQRYLSSYVGLSPHLQAIVFTGAVGQNRTVQRLVLAGVTVPRAVRVLTVPTDEERAIAEAVKRVVK